MKVVPAIIEDARKLNQIKTEAYRDEKKRFGPWQSRQEGGPDWYHHEWYNNVEETERLINEHHYFKIIKDDKIIGGFWLHDIDIITIELEDLCILPEYQGNGYGYKVLMIMEDIFPSKKKWVLGTPFYSVRNQYLYEKAGYIKTGDKANNMVYMYEKNIEDN